MQVPKDASEGDLRPLFEVFGEIVCLNVLRTQRGQGPSAGAFAARVRRCIRPCRFLVRRCSGAPLSTATWAAQLAHCSCRAQALHHSYFRLTP